MPRQLLHRLRKRRHPRAALRADGFRSVAYMNGCFVRQLNPSIERGRAIAIADGDHGSHSGLPRARDHLLAIGVELLAIEMCVRIYEHG